MSLEQFTYSYIFKISQSVYYTMNQLYMICTSTKSFIFYSYLKNRFIRPLHL